MQHLLVEHSGFCAYVQLNRPDKHNALDDNLIKELTETFEYLNRDDGVRVIVLGSNGKHFCAGADLGWMQRMAHFSRDENILDARGLSRLFQVMHELDKPIVSVVNGAAYGGALGLLCCSDVVIATDRSDFCFSEVKLGITPATISPYVLQKIGTSQARRYFLTAEVFDAGRARELGLVHRVCTTDQLDQHADEVIAALLQNGPLAMAATKQLLRELNPISDDVRNYTTELIADIRTSEEGQAGLHAFLNKQPPEWINS